MKEKNHTGRPRRKAMRIILTIICSLVGIYLIGYAVNFACSLALRSYIRSLEPVAYDSPPIVPEYDAALGHCAVKAERDLKVMMLSDIHLGGGVWSLRNDKKTVYEVSVMLREEKPDFVILGGDNTFAVPGPGFHGGGTLDNAMAARDLLELFEHEGVYFTTVFGNHDTESFDYASRRSIGKLYESDKYPHCFFRSEFSDSAASRPSVSNQLIAVENADGTPVRLILLMDTNDYIDGSISATINWQYDVLHPAQTEWAKGEIASLSAKAGCADGSALGTLCFFHIPIGEYETAYRELEANGFKDTADSKYIEGVWDEKVNDTMGGRIWFGGCYRTGESPASLDNFFETLGPDGIGALDACFCGHDHINSAVVNYRGVLLGYNYSVDNLAYADIASFGLQRGCTLFTLTGTGEWSYERKNVYTDCGADPDAFCHVSLDSMYYADSVP